LPFREVNSMAHDVLESTQWSLLMLWKEHSEFLCKGCLIYAVFLCRLQHVRLLWQRASAEGRGRAV
jgi:hypothetical protein